MNQRNPFILFSVYQKNCLDNALNTKNVLNELNSRGIGHKTVEINEKGDIEQAILVAPIEEDAVRTIGTRYNQTKFIMVYGDLYAEFKDLPSGKLLKPIGYLKSVGSNRPDKDYIYDPDSKQYLIKV